MSTKELDNIHCNILLRMAQSEGWADAGACNTNAEVANVFPFRMLRRRENIPNRRLWNTALNYLVADGVTLPTADILLEFARKRTPTRRGGTPIKTGKPVTWSAKLLRIAGKISESRLLPLLCA
jgi:hypothetical protein